LQYAVDSSSTSHQEENLVIEGLIIALDDKSASVKVQALDRLGEERALTQTSKEKVLAIAVLLQDSHAEVRGAAAWAIGMMGVAAAPHAPAIAALLQDSHAEVRRAAAWAIGMIGVAAAPHAPAIAALLQDSHAEVQMGAARALGAMGAAAAPHAPAIAALLQDLHAKVQMKAAQAPGAMGAAAAPHAPAIGSLLQGSDRSVREAAARALGAMGAAAAPHVPAITALLQDSDRVMRGVAAQALGAMRAAAAPHVPAIAALLQDSDSYVQWAAARALEAMGAAAAPHAPAIAALLQDSHAEVRGAAARALGAIGAAAAPHAPTIAALLQDSHAEVRGAAAQALVVMGAAAVPHVPAIAALLQDSHAKVRGAAAQALVAMGAATVPHVPAIAALLQDSHAKVRMEATQALVAMGAAAAPHAPAIAALLQDSNRSVQMEAARALGALGAAAAPHAPAITALLQGSDRVMQEAAARALGALGAAAAPHVPAIAALLQDSHAKVRGAAAQALEAMGAAAVPHAPAIAALLRDSDRSVQMEAARALGAMGAAAAPHAPAIAALLQDSDSGVQWVATQALEATGELDIESIIRILDPLYNDFLRAAELQLLAYCVSGGKERNITLITWLGRDENTIYDHLKHLKYEQGIHILKIFSEAWSVSDVSERLRNDLSQRISQVVQTVKWKSRDLELLKRHQVNLRKSRSPHQAVLDQAISDIQTKRRLNITVYVWVGHIGFWLALIFLYPSSPKVQAIFFWNPWVRRIAGFGYVSFILTWVPYFRSKLLAPFKDSLLADAQLDHWEYQTYFHQLDVAEGQSNHRIPISKAIPEIQGQIVLEGESGLGKTIFLRHLASHSKRVVVYLRADRCVDGVMEAIQRKLQGQAGDTEFLRNLIYSSAVDIYIDGLNEVTADTRARIVEFVEQYFKGNIILATQPLEWKAPATARTLVLQPLTPEAISAFLASRYAAFDIDHAPSKEKYIACCKQYLAEAFNESLPVEIKQAVQRILSNPMELTVVAQMLMTGKSPDLFHLQEQQYYTMAEDYESIHGQPFPFLAFAEQTYQLRLNGEALKTPSEIDFHNELLCMERPKHKMVRRRESVDYQNQPIRDWQFRHDKIMEFFIVQTFLGQDNERVMQHIDDPRFRGVYYLLATLLPLQDAEALREMLIQYAADTKDHSVSDTFIQLLRSRKMA
jgi:HEAT repeat protein